MDARIEEQRRRTVQAVKSHDTQPGVFVCRLFRGLGYRYHLNRKDLLGQPDVPLLPRRKVIFVRGDSGTAMAARRGVSRSRVSATGGQCSSETRNALDEKRKCCARWDRVCW